MKKQSGYGARLYSTALVVLCLLHAGAGCTAATEPAGALPVAATPAQGSVAAGPQQMEPRLSAYRAFRDFSCDLDRDGIEDACTLYLPTDCDGLLTDAYAVGAINGASGVQMGMQEVSHPDKHFYVDSMVCEPYFTDAAAYLLVGGEMTGTVLHLAYTVLEYRDNNLRDIFSEHSLEGLPYVLQLEDGPLIHLELETGDSYAICPSREEYLLSEWIVEDGTLTPPGRTAFGEHTTFMSLYASVEDETLVLHGLQELRGAHKLDVSAHLHSTWRYEAGRWKVDAYVAPVGDTIIEKHYDLDNDGMMDTVVSAFITTDIVTTLEIRPQGAEASRLEFDGVANTRTAAADVDGDGMREILYFAEAWGSNYGGGQAHIYRVRDGRVKELPSVHRHTLQEGCRGFLEMESPGLCTGLDMILLPDGREGVRVYQFGSWATTIVFDAVYDDSAGEWQVLQTHVQQSPDTRLLQADADARRAQVREHRPGFRLPEVDYAACDFDVDIPIIDSDTGVVLLTFRERAEIALRCLYDMLGYLPARCGVWGAADSDYASIWFGHTARNARYNRSFYSATINAVTGEAMYINMNYNGAYAGYVIDYGIPTEALVQPPGMGRMSPQEIALWYYEHSSYGTRESIQRVEQSKLNFGEDFQMLNLVLEDKRFYEVGFYEGCPFPGSYYGPYPEGFSH